MVVLLLDADGLHTSPYFRHCYIRTSVGVSMVVGVDAYGHTAGTQGCVADG